MMMVTLNTPDFYAFQVEILAPLQKQEKVYLNIEMDHPPQLYHLTESLPH